MAVIIPSILEETAESFKARASKIEKIPGISEIQVDFSDGIFAPHKTIMPQDLDILNPAFKWEAHLMAVDPKACFFDCKIAGFSKVIFHFEAAQDKNSLADLREKAKELKMSCALAVRPETEIEEILPYAADFEEILLLSVRPGFQGGKFIEETYGRLRKLRQGVGSAKIEIDGGIKPENAAKLAECGADFLVVGSELFEKAENGEIAPEKNFEKLQIALSAARVK